MTGTGRLRKPTASASSRAPAPLRPTGRMARPALGSVSSGSAPEPIWLAQSATVTSKPSPTTVAIGPARRPAAAAISARGAHEAAQRRQRLRQPVRIAVELEGGFQGREPDLVEAHGALDRVAGDAGHQFARTRDDAHLRPAQQLVAREGDEVGALGQRGPHGRLGPQPIAGEIDQCSRAQVVDEGDALCPRHARQARAPAPTS